MNYLCLIKEGKANNTISHLLLFSFWSLIFLQSSHLLIFRRVPHKEISHLFLISVFGLQIIRNL